MKGDISIGSKIRKMCFVCDTPKPQPGGTQVLDRRAGVRRFRCLECTVLAKNQSKNPVLADRLAE